MRFRFLDLFNIPCTSAKATPFPISGNGKGRRLCCKADGCNNDEGIPQQGINGEGINEGKDAFCEDAKGIKDEGCLPQRGCM